MAGNLMLWRLWCVPFDVGTSLHMHISLCNGQRNVFSSVYILSGNQFCMFMYKAQRPSWIASMCIYRRNQISKLPLGHSSDYAIAGTFA